MERLESQRSYCAVVSCPINILLLSCFLVGAGPYYFMNVVFEGLIFFVLPYEAEKYLTVVIGTVATALFSVITYPVIGAIGDIFYGRYKTLLYSMAIIIIGTALMAFNSLVETLNYEKKALMVYFAALSISWIGVSGFVAVMPFGADQLQEAPSADMCKWVRRSTCLFFIGRMCSDVIFRSCSLCMNKTQLFAVICTLQTLVTIGLIVLFLLMVKLRTAFVIEPKSVSPYKDVIQVLNFARKHKCPIRRSALTYWEQEIPSRIDLAKTKYGGSFTNEQVEAVKTCLRIIGVLLAMAMWPVPGDFAYDISDMMLLHMDFNLGTSISRQVCSLQSFLAMSNVIPLITAVSIFMSYEFMSPLVGHYFPATLKGYGIGMLLSCIPVLMFFTIDTVGHSLHPNVTCIFTLYDIRSNYTPTLEISAFALSPQYIINTVAYFIMNVTAHQFIFAQTPYSMRGAILGLYYSLRLLFMLNEGLVALPFFIFTFNAPISCGSVFLLFNIVLAVVSLVIFCVVMKKYKYRQRDDPVNDHLYQFAENYYGSITQVAQDTKLL